MHTGQRCETKWFSSLFPSKPVSVKSDRSIIGYLQRFHPLPRHNSSHTSLCLTPFLRKDLEETGWPIALVIITRWERHKPRQGETHQQHWHKNERRSNDRTIWSSVKSPHQPLPQHHFLVHVLCLFPLPNHSALKVLYFTHKWHKVRFIYSTGEVGPGWRSRNSDGLDGPGIECRWRPDFPHPSRPVLEFTQPPVRWVPGFFAEGQRPGSGFNHLPHLAPRLKK
jgi:hypothetical protein